MLATPPSMPAIWNTVAMNMGTHNQSSHERPRSRGPGIRSMVRSELLPVVTVWRPISTWMKTFSTHAAIMNQSSVKPAPAPSLGVTTSSPEPTMVAVMIRPGPS